jgi:DNA-binding transcriptional ArsR family regulator
LNTSDKITLDQDTFKVLASETRIGLLKKLDKTQMTVSDLARTMKMSKATLFEHLEKLINVGLIKKKEDDRKWVYYKLTWKGKNILHPERTKIAIVLTIFILAFIILSSFLIITESYNRFIPESKNIAIINVSSIEFKHVDDINENTISPDKIIININKDVSLGESSLEIEFSIQEEYIENIEHLTEWQELKREIEQNKISVDFPPVNWSNQTGKYFYIKCKIIDKAGNSEQNIYVEYIEKVYDGSFDLSIKNSDVEFKKNIDSIPRKDYQIIPVKIKIHNTGSYNMQNVTFSIFDNDPDSDKDGFVDNLNYSILTKNVESIESGKVEKIEINIKLNLSTSENFWISIDPKNEFNESNELNNIIKVNLKSFISTSTIPEFPLYSVLLFVIFLIFLSWKANKRNLKK